MKRPEEKVKLGRFDEEVAAAWSMKAPPEVQVVRVYARWWGRDLVGERA